MSKIKEPKPAISLRGEKRLLLLIDILCNLFCCAGLTVAGLFYTELPLRYLIVLSLTFTVVVIVFMTALEEYKPTFTPLQERRVIIVLSVLYTYVLFSLIDLIFYRSLAMFIGLSILFVADILLMVLANIILYQSLSDPKKYRKLRLLLIADKNGDLHRLKRMKYGTLSRYDTWYEPIDSTDPKEVEQLWLTHFENYDAVCVYDNIKDDVYDAIVNHAMLCNKAVYIVPRLVDINRSQANSVRFDDVLTVYIQKYEISRVEEFFKRVMDILLGVIALILAAIPMAIVALLIKLTSPGPVFYRQERYTKNKKIFKIIKFRTMIPDAEKLSGPMFAQKNDSRITPIGKILRSYRLDELPQIFNILAGDMSIVGPRPERPYFVQQFEKSIENYDYRFVVKAGLTSLSHVYGRYSTYIHDRTCYDLLYISNYSLLLDLKIILLTTKTLFIKTAAEGEDAFKASANDLPKDSNLTENQSHDDMKGKD